MKAIVAMDQAAEAAGITLAERPEPTPAINDVVVEVHASGFVPAEWEWPSTWFDRSGHDRAQAIIGHEFAGVVSSLGYGTTGLSLGQRVFGITDWHRDGTLAEYAAVEARNLAPLPGNVDFRVGASLPISGLTAWQGLFQHGRVQAGQSVLAHGAAGAVGSVVTQLAREFGAYVIGTGRAADRQAALDFGANEFLDLDHEDLDDIGRVDLVFDVIGGDIQRRSASIIRPGGTLVSVVGPAEARPVDGLAIDFVVESVPSQLVEIVDQVRDGHGTDPLWFESPCPRSLVHPAHLSEAEREMLLRWAAELGGPPEVAQGRLAAPACAVADWIARCFRVGQHAGAAVGKHLVPGGCLYLDDPARRDAVRHGGRHPRRRTCRRASETSVGART